jgi:hypothetical protein
MIALIQAYALLLAQSGTPMNAPCQPVNSKEVRARVDTILALRSPQRRAEGTSDLAGYWKDRCLDSRRTIEPGTVRYIARLLAKRENRLMATFILVDVTENLKAAEPAVSAALTSQVRSDKRLFRGGYSTLPPSVLHIANALQCIEMKIRTSRVDPVLCADLVRYDAELDQIKGRSH